METWAVVSMGQITEFALEFKNGNQNLTRRTG